MPQLRFVHTGNSFLVEEVVVDSLAQSDCDICITNVALHEVHIHLMSDLHHHFVTTNHCLIQDVQSGAKVLANAPDWQPLASTTRIKTAFMNAFKNIEKSAP